MIARISWLATLLAIAIVAVGVQLDRQTIRNPVLASGVPQFFRSSAQLPIAAYSLNRGNPQEALAQANLLVQRRPLPAEHLRLLAQAQFEAGEFEQGALTIQYAAQRGWRDPLAQESMLRLALEAGDKSEAARRFAALFLRRDTEDELLLELAPLVLDEPQGAGRQTLATIVGGGSRWHDQFLRRGARVMPPDAFVEIVENNNNPETPFDCAVLGQITPVVASRDAVAGDKLTALVAARC